MRLPNRQLFDALGRMPFIDSVELALILGEPHSTVHRAPTALLADGIIGRVSHGTAHLPSSQRYHLTAKGIGETAWVLGFGTPSDFVRAYPMSREWLTLLIRRMDAEAAVYRLAASLSPGIDGLQSQVEFHRRGRLDATIWQLGTLRVDPEGLLLTRLDKIKDLSTEAPSDVLRTRLGFCRCERIGGKCVANMGPRQGNPFLRLTTAAVCYPVASHWTLKSASKTVASALSQEYVRTPDNPWRFL